MRELHAWHGDRRHGGDAPADSPVPHHRHSPRHEILRDPADRIAAHLDYRKVVEAYPARHRKPEQPAPEQPAPEQPPPEQSPQEPRDKPAGRIAERRESPERQEQKQRGPQRPRLLPSNETAQAAAGASIFVSSIADAVNVLPGRWDAVAASFLGALAAGVAWGNKRWKDRHGNRPED